MSAVKVCIPWLTPTVTHFSIGPWSPGLEMICFPSMKTLDPSSELMQNW